MSSVKTRPNIKPSADARNAKNAANMQYLCKWAAPQGAINGPNEISMPKVAQSAINEKRENILTGLEVASKNNKWKKRGWSFGDPSVALAQSYEGPAGTIRILDQTSSDLGWVWTKC